MSEGYEFGREAGGDLPRMGAAPRDGDSLDPDAGTPRRGIGRLRDAHNTGELAFDVRGAVPKESADPVLTVFDRLVAAGLPQQRVEWHLGAGRVTLDGRIVTDPHCPAPPGTRLLVEVQ
jgi:hypothetical protein